MIMRICASKVWILLLMMLAPGGHPAQLVATWWEEGAHAELRLTLRADGRATKELRRQCIERSDQECIPLRYEGRWDADAKKLTVHLPGGDERYLYVRSGNFLKLTGAHGKTTSFIVQFPEAEGKDRPKVLCGSWTEKSRTLTLRPDGGYVDKDEDGEVHGNWWADRDKITMVPTGGGDATTYAYRSAKGVLVLKSALGAARTFRAAP
jgi:hypothetical protein